MRVSDISKITAGSLIALACVVGWAGSALAITGSQFQPGRIMDDQVFYNPNAMTVQQVQTFLDELVPTCDSAGNDYFVGSYTKNGVTTTYVAPPGTPNIQRKNLDSNDPAPYTCLKDYYENVTTHVNNIGDPTTVPSGSISAAQIIVNAAQTYDINPEVLIDLIEKESLGPLTTDDWPWPDEYTTATGYGCPDSTPGVCDSSYYGFYNQVTLAAHQFHLYTENPNNYNFTIGANSILYHPTPSSCGTESVNIQDQTTANLYDYTPYVPDQAALNNLYGSGDGCSSYGNRNFWRIFNDWFGSTLGLDQVSDNLTLVGSITPNLTSPIPGQDVSASYTIQNVTSSPITIQASVLQCRYNQTTTCDPAWGGPVTIGAGDQQAFDTDIGTVQAGSYTLTPYFEIGGTWYRYLSSVAGADSLPFTVPPYVASVQLVGPITSSPASLIPGQSVTVGYTVKNTGTDPAIFQNSILQCRLNTTTNCDPALNAPVTIAPGDQQTFSNTFTVKAGSYAFTPYFEQNGAWYTYGLGTASSTSLGLSVPAYVADMQLTAPVAVSPAAPIPGQTMTVSYSVQNDGSEPAIYENSLTQCRLNTNTVCDPAWNAPMTIAPGGQQTFTNTFTAQAGTYVFTPYYEQNEAWYKYGLGAETANTLTVAVPAYVADVQLVGPITSSPANPTAGQSATISYTVENLGTEPAIFQSSVLQCRLNTTINCDPAWGGPVTIGVGDQQIFSNTFTVRAGSYWFTPYFEQNGTWHLFTRDAATYTGNQLPLSVP